MEICDKACFIMGRLQNPLARRIGAPDTAHVEFCNRFIGKTILKELRCR